MYHQDIWPTGDTRDQRDIADEIEVELVVQRRVNCVRRTAEEKRIAVWWRTHDRVSGQTAGSTPSIFDDEWLAEPFRQPLTHQTREDVKRAAGAKADDDAHRPARIGLRPRDTRHDRKRGRTGGKMQELSSVGKFHRIFLSMHDRRHSVSRVSPRGPRPPASRRQYRLRGDGGISRASYRGWPRNPNRSASARRRDPQASCAPPVQSAR